MLHDQDWKTCLQTFCVIQKQSEVLRNYCNTRPFQTSVALTVDGALCTCHGLLSFSCRNLDMKEGGVKEQSTGINLLSLHPHPMHLRVFMWTLHLLLGGAPRFTHLSCDANESAKRLFMCVGAKYLSKSATKYLFTKHI